MAVSNSGCLVVEQQMPTSANVPLAFGSFGAFRSTNSAADCHFWRPFFLPPLKWHQPAAAHQSTHFHHQLAPIILYFCTVPFPLLYSFEWIFKNPFFYSL